jgi:hypothetical protein
MAKTSKYAAPRKKYRGSRTLTIIFYTVYVVLALALVFGILQANSRLENWLSDYENTHAGNRS